MKSCGRPPPAGQHAHDEKMPIRFRDWRTRRDGWPLSVFNVFAVVAVIGLLFFDLPDDAADAANCARGAAPQAVRGIGAPWSGAHLILLDVQAQPATISWISGHAPTGATPALFPALYLGTANGWVVVYRKFRDHPKVLRLPVSGVVVNITADTETCKSAH